MSELKLVVGDETAPSGPPAAEAHPTNNADALNRRDIELIKRSLATMHKDCAELRAAIVSLHASHERTPSRRFFVGLGVLAFVVFAALTAFGPQIQERLHPTGQASSVASP